MVTRKIEYGVCEDESTGDVWAIKSVNGQQCGARRLRENERVGKINLSLLIYEVGDDFDYYMQMRFRFAVYPQVQ